MRPVTVLALVVSLLHFSMASAFDKPPFPRLAGTWIGDARYNEPDV